MYTLLLVIIYLAFISLGLPDSLIGSAWPVMHQQLDVPLSYAGILTMIISGGTIISSLMSDRATRKLGTALVTASSVLMTAVALFGFSISRSFFALCLWAIPYGLGAGAIDASLNNYVALNYSSRHLSWLHCFWGVGASISPYIMSYFLMGEQGWKAGYRSVGLIQIAITAVLFISMPLWKSQAKKANGNEDFVPAELTLRQAVKIRGVKYMLLTFFAYCGLEHTAMLWSSSYLVEYRAIDVETAARFGSLFFFGITFGRFLTGFVSEKLGDRRLIRIGIATIAFGVFLVGLPVKVDIFSLVGLVIIGLGCAPVYPSIIHSTPYNFGRENSQAIIGIQMASAYVGSTFMPPIFGLIAQHINIGLYPLFLMFFVGLMIIMSERLNNIIARLKASQPA